MPTFTTTALVTQPAGATQETYNNHRKLFVDSTGRYWYCGFTHDATEPLTSTALSIDIYWADDPEGVWTKESIATDSDFGSASGSDLNACFAEAQNGDIVVLAHLSGDDPDWEQSNENFHAFRRTGDDVTPGWVEQARPTFAYDAGGGAALGQTNFTILNHPDDSDVWIIIHADKDSGDSNPTDLSYTLSADNMATWDAPVILKAGVGNGDAIAERGGLAVATGDGNRTLYLLWVDSRVSSDVLSFARLTAWDTSPTLSTIYDVDSGSSSTPHFAVAAAWRSDGTLDVFYNQYNGSFLNYIIRHRNISVVDGVPVMGAETQLDNTQHQQAGPYGAYLNQDDEYQFYWVNGSDVGFEAIEGAATTNFMDGSQNARGLSTANNHAMDKDFAGSPTYGQLLRGTFVVTYGLAPNGSTVQYSIVVADTTQIDAPITTAPPTTPVPSTAEPVTGPPTTLGPTLPPTSPIPTAAPTSVLPTTDPDLLPTIACVRSFRYPTREAVARAWLNDENGQILEDVVLDPQRCWMELFAEGVSKGRVVGSVDAAGGHIVFFRLPQVLPQPGHAYFLRVHMELDGNVSLGQRDFPMGTR